MKKYPFLLTILVAFASSPARATVLIEDFEADFPAWETAWFGSNSNATNYYGVGAGRGNNPDGLWIQDDGAGDQNIRVVFKPSFAVSLTSLSFDVAGYSDGTRLEFFDAGGVTLSDVLITLTLGAFSDPGTYVNYGTNSNSGIGGFRFYSAAPEGNTSIDNIVASTDAAVPEPSSILFLSMAGGILIIRRRA